MCVHVACVTTLLIKHVRSALYIRGFVALNQMQENLLLSTYSMHMRGHMTITYGIQAIS